MDFRKMNQLNSDDNPIPVVDQDPMESLNNPNFSVDPEVDREPQLSDIDVQKEIDMVSDDMSLDIPEGISENPQAPEPMISEGLNRQQILDAYRRLKPAQEKYQQDLSNIGILQGANMIAQGFARGHGANIGAGEEGIKALQAQAKEPVDAIGRELDTAKNTMGTSKMLMDYEEAEKMNDPNSDVSKLYREQAYKILGEKSPLVGKLENMSASQLQKLGFKSPLNNRTNNRYVTIQEPDGTIRSKLIDMDTGATIKDLGLAGYAYGNMVDPRTQEVLRLSKSDPNQLPTMMGRPSQQGIETNIPSTPIKGQSSEQKETPVVRNPYQVKGLLDTYERNMLDKDVEKFQTEIKDEKRIISEIGAITDSTVELAKKNPNAAKTLGAQIAKIMQGSRLTDADVELYTGQSGVVNKISDFVNESILGKISADKAKNITQVLNAYNTALRKSLEDRANQAATINLQNYNPNLKIRAEEVAPLYYLSDKHDQKTSKSGAGLKSGEVRRQTSDGRVGIFDSNTKKFLRWDE